jgi:multidrug resistance efflux pump
MKWNQVLTSAAVLASLASAMSIEQPSCPSISPQLSQQSSASSGLSVEELKTTNEVDQGYVDQDVVASLEKRSLLTFEVSQEMINGVIFVSLFTLYCLFMRLRRSERRQQQRQKRRHRMQKTEEAQAEVAEAQAEVAEAQAEVAEAQAAWEEADAAVATLAIISWEENTIRGRRI